MKGGFIYEMALKRKRRLTAEGITVSVICCLVLVPLLFSFLILPTNYWDNLSPPRTLYSLSE